VRLAALGDAAAREVRVTVPPLLDLSVTPPPRAHDVARMAACRAAANAAFFGAEADRIAELCACMADRFGDGGRLLATGHSPSARSDVRHVAVEFVHPVIVGKRALPAIGLTSDGGALQAQVALLARPRDIVFAFGSPGGADEAELAGAIDIARARGCLTVGTHVANTEYHFQPPAEDAFVSQEVVETLYHVLWELVHVFFEHGVVSQTSAQRDPGPSGFLYPFLTTRPRERGAVTRDVAASVRLKVEDVDALRGRSVAGTGAAASIHRAAALVRERLDQGGTVLAFGNGGSATDAMDLVADFRTPPAGLSLAPRPALDLTSDPAILTALSNDIGNDVVFARQIIACGRPGDVAVGFSTSGNSRNVIAALVEARHRELTTICFAGYDGGRIADEQLADVTLVAASQYVPRIQEAHATAYHALRMLVG
jgi:D-sedoheptulose 7-phosphate isomerase